MALSGGMAQRLMVARAIMHRPQILFLDEPTAGLDPQSRIALWEIVRGAARRRPDDPADHALHGGGRPALRPRGHHGPRPHPRPRHAGRPEAVHRRRQHRARSRPTGDLDHLADAPASNRRRRHRAPGSSTARSHAVGHRAAACCPAIIDAADADRRRRSPTSRSASRRSRPSSSTSPGRTCANEHHHRRTAATPTPAGGLAQLRPAAVAYRQAFVALLHRDLHVLRKNFAAVHRAHDHAAAAAGVRVHLRVPEDRPGRRRRRRQRRQFTTTLVAGVVGLAIVFQGIQAVALPLVQEFGYSKEIEDRVLAPLPTQLVGRPEDRDRHAATA